MTCLPLRRGKGNQMLPVLAIGTRPCPHGRIRPVIAWNYQTVKTSLQIA